MRESHFSNNSNDVEAPAVPLPHSRGRTGLLNLALFIATALTMTGFGSALAESFARNKLITVDLIADGYVRLARLDSRVWMGLTFSLPLLAILLAHELGHYLECRKRHVDATLPYFLPSPSLFGTFGAFIKIRSPIYTREGLFDIGIGGPLAGFLTLVPIIVTGVILSKPVSSVVSADSITFGTPLALRLLEELRFPGVPSAHILLHPAAMAAWAGLFATALNLLPIGQLDGGHIVYALGSEYWHRRISLAFALLLAIAGFFYWPWWLWGLGTFFFGRRHPLVYDSARLSPRRILLSFAALVIFILSATLVPVR